MTDSAPRPQQSDPPPDQDQRSLALDPARSVLVQAPAGSGKTDLLTRRFLRLLAEVDDPGHIVAITFTRAAAAEMRHRILSELEKASAAAPPSPSDDALSMPVLAYRAYQRSIVLKWQLIDIPAQLRISTIDSFSREIALQQPLLTELGSEIGIHEMPAELYRRAARRTLETIGSGPTGLSQSIETLLRLRDNNWQEMEEQLVSMLDKRHQWMHDFVLDREPDWPALRARLERPFARALHAGLSGLSFLLNQVPEARDEILDLARFAFQQNGAFPRLASLREFPSLSSPAGASTSETISAFQEIAHLLLIKDGVFRKRVDKTIGFPPESKSEKNRLLALIGKFSQISGFGARLAGMRSPPPAGYTDDEWEIVRAAFRVLRQAAAELRIVFAEAGVFDFTEVAQMAGRVLRDADGLPTEAALGIADGIRHLLIDEFQDTSRRQHQLLADLVAAWPDRNGRSVFVVGDPAQSIYSFRDADAELFPRVRQYGLEIRGEQPLQFDFAQLSANFRTEPSLVTSLNEAFDAIFAVPDGSGIEFAPSQPARPSVSHASPRFNSHFMFMPALKRGKTSGALTTQARSAARVARDATFRAQTGGIIDIVRSHLDRMEQARACGQKYRIAVLARVGKSLDPIALALREAAIPFRAVELEHLRDRPEILDALALARALLNPLDRVAWLGVLRAPWCGLSLNDLHVLTSSDDSGLLARPIPELLTGRRHLLSVEGRVAVLRLCQVLQSVPALQSVLPTASLGTRLSQIWLMLGGAACVDAASAANLELLWSSLDSLSGGEQDLIGPALDAALKQLTALPGPGAESDCGVQLMTIHKSKGLEFEVVIVPDLQVRGGSGNQDMLSWLERGITKPDSPGDEITEFLVAPIQPRGSDRGIAKAWVDEILRERDDQEARRIFYVAATRARDELHLLACIAYSDAEDEVELTPPSRTLLATAWPALHAEAQTQFSRWWSTSVDHSGVLKDLAALEGTLITMPTPPGSAIIRRLPADFQPPTALPGPPSAAPAVVGSQDLWLYERHQGGLLSRSLGTAVHTLLEALTTLRISHDWDDARAFLHHLVPRITGQIRASGVPAPQAKSLAAQALDIALAASRDVHGQWILSPHADAGSEAAWTGVLAGQVHAVRVDRVFRAAHAPLAEGEDTWWIIDYKTAHEDGLDPSDALPRLRSLFAPQLEIYAAILRNLHGAQAPIHAGLYYPRMAQFDWWQAG